MKAMVLQSLADIKTQPTPLSLLLLPEPTLTEGELLIRVTHCGVCHTELDEIEGRTPPPHLPVVLGHQVVGVIEGIQRLREASLRDPTLDRGALQSQEKLQ